MRRRAIVLISFCLAFGSDTVAQSGDEETKTKDPMSAGTFEGLRFRSIGPAVTSGRIGDIAVDPTDRARYYVAAASGGVWKTSNAGTTWEPVFDKEKSYSIGCVTIDPRNPSVVWVGTGENNSQRSVSYGDGVYRTEDGGKSWQNMGLNRSEHIGKILIDPRNSSVVYVAAQGPLWSPGGDRGLYKTTDAGKTWKAVLTISENTGVTDVAIDPRDPDVLYAAAYQRRRHVWTIINGGPESALYKSTDAGGNWKKLSSGLPTVDMGRIGLAVSLVNPDVIFATVEAAQKKGGFFRSLDRGATWEKRNDYGAGSAQYYSEIFADPKDVNRVYMMDVYLKVTDDGGKTFRNLGEKHKHVDNHAMWIDPSNTNHYLVGCDGGLYESFDRAETWSFKSNLPVTQFYRVAVDNATPFYNVLGGTQDNFSLSGPSRTLSITGIENADWVVTATGDGFTTQIDPNDPNIVYAQSQYGGLVRYDRKSGEIMGIKPQEAKGEEPYRWNWDSPLLISPHSPTRLYFAANKLFRSDDRGNSWKAVSPDLTRQLDRNTLPVMGKVWGVDAVAKNASTSLYGNITALAESPRKEGLLCVGTDDGLIQVSEDGGGTWRKSENFPGVPPKTFVSRLEASLHDVNVLYAAFDNHKNGDFAPYLLKSDDAGRRWTSIRGDLPENGPVYAVAEDHANTNLLFVGTEFGVFFTVDGGKQWIQLKGDLPTIAVRDIAIQRRENDLVLGTFGRGFYILDNYTPLRLVTRKLLDAEAHLFPVKDALMYVPSRPYGLRGKAFLGESFYAAENPPFGATCTYYLRDKLKTLKELRLEEEKEALKGGKLLAYPTAEQLRAEDEEEAPSIILTISDEAGNVVRRLAGTNAKGMNRVTWDLRYAAPSPVDLSPKEDDPFSEGDMGRLALPGTYVARLSMRVRGVVTELSAPQKFTASALGVTSLPASDRVALAEFQKKVANLQRAILGAGKVLDDVKSRIALLRKAIQDAPGAPANLQDTVATVENRMNELLRLLRGDGTLRARNEGTPPSITERIENITGDQWQSTSAPTQTQIDAYRIAGEEFLPLLGGLRTLVDVQLKGVENILEKAGAPWTPGRIPEWKPE
jgi:photosystem II stability/assembly factor-like uncharacterized protein